MSLIVARKINNKLILVGDTKLTYPYKDKNSPKDGTIKSIIFNSTISVCFAGDVYYAEEALKEIALNYDLENIKSTLLKWHLESEISTDFIIAVGCNEPHFITIKDGSITLEEQCWIGSIDGFRKFQELYLSDYVHQYETGFSSQVIQQPASKDEFFREQYNKLYEAMVGVIESHLINEVGGFIIPLIFEENKFSYQCYVNIFRKPINIDKEVRDQRWSTIGFGGAEEGSFTVNFSGGYNAELAIHFYQGDIGVVYSRAKNSLLNPKIYKMDEIDFNEFLTENYKVKLAFSLASHTANYAIKAEKAFNEEHYDIALNRINQAIKLSSKTWGPNPDRNAEYESLIYFIQEKGHADIPQAEVHNLILLFILQGRSYLAKKHYNSAIDSLNQALRMKEDSLGAMYHLGLVKANMGKYKEALKVFNECIEKHQHLDSYYSIGAVYFHTKQYEKAKLSFLEVLSKNREHKLAKIALKQLVLVND